MRQCMTANGMDEIEPWCGPTHLTRRRRRRHRLPPHAPDSGAALIVLEEKLAEAYSDQHNLHFAICILHYGGSVVAPVRCSRIERWFAIQGCRICAVTGAQWEVLSQVGRGSGLIARTSADVQRVLAQWLQPWVTALVLINGRAFRVTSCGSLRGQKPRPDSA